MTRNFIATAVFFMSSFAWGAPAQHTCGATEFPYPQKMSDQELTRAFKSTDRQELVQYFYAELGKSQENPVIGKKLATYLEKTETKSDLRDYYQALATAAHLTADSSESKSIPLVDICSLESRVYSIIK